jgi:hypothetical protein
MPSDSSSVNELLLQILVRLGRIEEQLAKGTPSRPQTERGSLEDMLRELLDRMGRMERSRDDLSERMRRIERDVDHQRSLGRVSSQRIGSRSKRRPPSDELHIEGPITPHSAAGPTASEPGPVPSGERPVRRRSLLVEKLTERPAGQTSQRSAQSPRKRRAINPKTLRPPED